MNIDLWFGFFKIHVNGLHTSPWETDLELSTFQSSVRWLLTCKEQNFFYWTAWLLYNKPKNFTILRPDVWKWNNPSYNFILVHWLDKTRSFCKYNGNCYWAMLKSARVIPLIIRTRFLLAWSLDRSCLWSRGQTGIPGKAYGSLGLSRPGPWNKLRNYPGNRLRSLNAVWYNGSCRFLFILSTVSLYYLVVCGNDSDFHITVSAVDISDDFLTGVLGDLSLKLQKNWFHVIFNVTGLYIRKTCILLICRPMVHYKLETKFISGKQCK